MLVLYILLFILNECHKRVTDDKFMAEQSFNLRPVFGHTFQTQISIIWMVVSTSDNPNLRVRATLPVSKIILFYESAFGSRILQGEIQSS
jgi:hypothetical protein